MPTVRRALGVLAALGLIGCGDDGVAPGGGTLEVTISGLPAGQPAVVHIVGPEGFARELAASTAVADLRAGSYTVAATAFDRTGDRWAPTPPVQTVTVSANATTTAAVAYAVSARTVGVQQLAMAALQNPVYLTSPANDPRLFIVEQPGRIRIYKDGALLPAPFLDIVSIVMSGGEQGLLSVAFDPSYATNGRFYVYHNDLNGDIAVARYTATLGSDVANAGSREPVITIPHPVQGNHNGGLALFGPDGMLYLGTGDGGGGGDPSNNAQNTNSLLGKLLRIDVTTLPYAIPGSNPLAGATPGADEIWAYGLRNPWRYAFDAPAGQLYIADVGPNLWEEVNAVATTEPGVNYGWRVMEGTHCFNATTCSSTGLTLPVLEYSHGDGCSITGGFVYRGTAVPELSGHYLYSDFCSGFLRSFRLSNGQAVDQRTWPIGNVGNIMSFGMDAAGELYMLSLNGGVYRLVRQ